MKSDSGYRELEHTADWELEVWAPDMHGLMEESAHGMYALMGTELEPYPVVEKEISLRILDNESLLVDFLNELLWLGEDEGLAFDRFVISERNGVVKIIATGSKIATTAKEIKAVTFHNMHIQSVDEGLTVSIVFDV